MAYYILGYSILYKGASPLVAYPGTTLVRDTDKNRIFFCRGTHPRIDTSLCKISAQGYAEMYDHPP